MSTSGDSQQPSLAHRVVKWIVIVACALVLLFLLISIGGERA
jgi:membrane-associated PAP2 superfamily phosphatase